LQFAGQTNVQVFGDRDRIGQVLINLLTNAIKYSPQADKVIVCVSTDQGQAILSVQDFGIGIVGFHQEHIFERFYQVTEPAEKKYPGLGIGLYISKEIVRRHDGKIWVESQKGQGTTFYVSLPLRSEKK
jgi:signal transduction histidine kinase